LGHYAQQAMAASLPGGRSGYATPRAKYEARAVSAMAERYTPWKQDILAHFPWRAFLIKFYF